jgi:RNA recognition motif-containing protein
MIDRHGVEERLEQRRRDPLRIFVGNLAWATTEEALSELFGPYGTVDRAQIATWRDNGRIGKTNGLFARAPRERAP